MKFIKNIFFYFVTVGIVLFFPPFILAETYCYVRRGSNYAIASEVLNSGGYNGDGGAFPHGKKSVHYTLKDSIGTAIANSLIHTSNGYTITTGCLSNSVNDNDGDNLLDSEEIFNYRTDPDNSDTDNDGFGDLEEINTGANPTNPEDTPIDTDLDGIRNYIDSDDDNDGYIDTVEIQEGTDPLDELIKPADNDGDLDPDSTDPDDDNDGHSDIEDVFIFDASEWLDTDMDGIGNNADTDDDNDGYTDTVEISEGTDPLNALIKPADNDGDLDPDSTDLDDDNDGYTDTEEEDRRSDPFDANSYPVIYVNRSAAGDRTGISWDDAYLTINEAIRDGQYEIWAAEGTYRERIYLRGRDIRLYGGFSGTEQYRDERNVLDNETIISSSSTSILSRDSMVVIIGSTGEAVIDGFIVRSYNSRYAVHLYATSVRFINNTIQQDYNSGYGIYAMRDSSIIARNKISGKMQYGIYCYNSSTTIENNIIDCRYNEGVRINGGLVLLVNNTILGKNGGIILESGNPELYNNIIFSGVYPIRELRIIDPIIYNNNLYTGKNSGPVYVDMTKTGPRRLYTISQVNALNNSRSNILINPKFISSQDLHLRKDSLCIDMGYYMEGTRLDIDGQIIPNSDSNLYEIGADEWYGK